MSHNPWVNELIQVVGQKYVLTAKEDLLCYSIDGSFMEHNPDAIVRPANKDEVVKVVKIANRYKLPIVSRGAGTCLSAGTVPLMGGLVVDLTRMDRVIKVDVKNRVAMVEPGTITQNFTDAVAKAGLLYPPDPASSKISTIGGNIGECAGGPKCVKYGATRDYVLGFEVVLSDGSVVEVGNNVDGDMCGPDWASIMCGSEGTLGIITRITVRLVPIPEHKVTMLVRFKQLGDAGRAVSATMASGIIPTTLELMDNAAIKAVEGHLHIGLPLEAAALLLIEVDGDPSTVEDNAKGVEKICFQCGAEDVQLAKNSQEAQNLWSARRAIATTVGKLCRTKVSEDVTVPRSRIPEMVERIRTIAQKYDLKLLIYGHIGDGNFHPNILTDKTNKEEMARVEKAIKELFEAAMELEGTLSGEHGIGYMKAPYLRMETGEIGFQTAKMVKEIMDPVKIMNPGKMFDYEAYEQTLKK